MIFDENEKPVDYRFLEINPSFEKQTGLIDAQGKRMRELAPKHEEHWFEIYGKIALTGQPARFQNRAEQLHRWYDVYAFRFGKPEDRQVAILFNDITERKQAEDTLKLTKFSVDHASVSAFLIGKDARILYVNEQACRRFSIPVRNYWKWQSRSSTLIFLFPYGTTHGTGLKRKAVAILKQCTAKRTAH